MQQEDQSKITSSRASESRRIYQGSLQPQSFPGLPSQWFSEWETFPSSDGRLQLYAVSHRASAESVVPERKFRKPQVLVVFHGMGEHGGRYLHFPHYLQSEIDQIYCLDHRGHGRSEGPRGYVSNFDLFADDGALAIQRLNEALHKRFGQSVDLHLFAHSMGGLIALRMLLRFENLPIRSVSLSAPLLGIAARVPPVKKAAGRILAKIWGSMQMASEVDASILSHDQDVVIAYQTDRLVHKKITPSLFVSMEAAMADTLKGPVELKYPVQFLIPMADQLVDSEISLKYYSRLKMQNKVLKTYPGFFHESHNEIGKEQVFADILSWLRETHSGG